MKSEMELPRCNHPERMFSGDSRGRVPGIFFLADLYLIYDNMIAKRLIEETLEFLENLLFYRRVRFEIV